MQIQYQAPMSFTDSQTQILEEAGILKAGDLRTIETYCIQVSVFREAMKQVNKDGVINTYTNQNNFTNIVKSPALAVAEKANTLGLTPAA